MKKLRRPENWDSIQPKEMGEFTKLPAGAYHCHITSVVEKKSKAGNEMLELEFDIASGEYAGHFAESQYKPIYRQVTEESSLEYFRGMILAIEESNPGYKWDWNPNSLIGKQVAVVFGEEEYMKDGAIAVSVKPRWLRSLQVLREGNIQTPKIVKYKGNGSEYTPAQNTSNNAAADTDFSIDELLNDDSSPQWDWPV